MELTDSLRNSGSGKNIYNITITIYNKYEKFNDNSKRLMSGVTQDNEIRITIKSSYWESHHCCSFYVLGQPHTNCYVNIILRIDGINHSQKLEFKNGPVSRSDVNTGFLCLCRLFFKKLNCERAGISHALIQLNLTCSGAGQPCHVTQRNIPW